MLPKKQTLNEYVICFEIKTDKLQVIEPCNHEYHQDCVKAYLEQKLKEGSCEFGCLDESCKEMVGDFILKKFFTADQMDKRDSLSLQKAVESDVDMSWCPTPDCNQVFVKI